MRPNTDSRTTDHKPIYPCAESYGAAFHGGAGFWFHPLHCVEAECAYACYPPGTRRESRQR